MKPFDELRIGDVIKFRWRMGGPCFTGVVIQNTLFESRGIRYYKILSWPDGKEFHMDRYHYMGECSPEEEFAVRMES